MATEQTINNNLPPSSITSQMTTANIGGNVAGQFSALSQTAMQTITAWPVWLGMVLYQIAASQLIRIAPDVQGAPGTLLNAALTGAVAAGQMFMFANSAAAARTS